MIESTIFFLILIDYYFLVDFRKAKFNWL